MMGDPQAWQALLDRAEARRRNAPLIIGAWIIAFVGLFGAGVLIGVSL